VVQGLNRTHKVYTAHVGSRRFRSWEFGPQPRAECTRPVANEKGASDEA
jgi:hypothetical protein